MRGRRHEGQAEPGNSGFKVSFPLSMPQLHLLYCLFPLFIGPLHPSLFLLWPSPLPYSSFFITFFIHLNVFLSNHCAENPGLGPERLWDESAPWGRTWSGEGNSTACRTPGRNGYVLKGRAKGTLLLIPHFRPASLF